MEEHGRVLLILLSCWCLSLQEIGGSRDWQNCRQFRPRFCNTLCGVSGYGFPDLCSRPGICVCPPSTPPPTYCKEPSTFDYHELVNCRNRQKLCALQAQASQPNSTIPYVCTDLKGKISELDQTFFRYCVCFPS